MFLRLILIFSIVPLIELALLIKIGEYLGVLPTIILVAGTGIIGISLARQYGFQLFKEVKKTLENGQIPADHLIEGLLILVGAVMLLTPGLLTDTAGFLLIIPVSRHMVARIAKNRIKQWIDRGKFHVSYGEYRDQSRSHDQKHKSNDGNGSIDVDFEDIQD